MKINDYTNQLPDSSLSPMIAKKESDWRLIKRDPKKVLNAQFDEIINEFDFLLEKLRIKYPSLTENQIIILGASLYQSNTLRNEQDIFVRNMLDDANIKVNCYCSDI